MARVGLGLGVRDLAKLAEVSPNTVSRLEGGGETNATTRRAIRRALEEAGVEFLDENGSGPGVRLRKRSGEAPAPQDGREVAELADAAGKPGPVLVRGRQRRKA